MMPEPPRSGVAGLSPRHVRDRLIRNGWGVLPIVAHDAPGKGAGKRPLIQRWQEFAAFDAPRPSLADLGQWDRAAGRAPGTGIPCGDVIGIDIDVFDLKLATALQALAFETLGETALVRQGRKPKVLLVYAAAEPIAKAAYKALDGTGDGLDVLGAGSQFVGFGVHPVEGKPYAWLGSESPLTVSPDTLPKVSAAMIAAFVDRVRGVMPLSKAGAGRGKGGAGAEIVRDAEGFVIDGREAYLTRIVHGVGCELHATGEPFTLQSLSNRAWSTFEQGARLVVDGRAWTRQDAETKASAWLDRVSRGLIRLGPAIERTEPTYPDERRPVEEASEEVGRIVRSFFAEHVRGYKNAVAVWEADFPANPLLRPPELRHWAVRVEAGIGKTDAAIAAIAGREAAGLSVAVAVPTIDLGEQLAIRLWRRGVDARVYRGRKAPDPESTDGDAMCLNLEAVAHAREAGARSVFESACERRDRTSAEALRCPMFHRCGHVRQRSATPRVWIIPHASLFTGRPGFIPKLDALVIDEKFFDGAIPDRPVRLTIDEIERAGLPHDEDQAQALSSLRASLVHALRATPDGHLTPGSLLAAGIDEQAARRAHGLEWKRRIDPSIFPGMNPRERAEAAALAGRVNREVFALAGLWNELTAFLEAGWPASGRMRLTLDPETKARTVERRSLNMVAEGWRAPALLLDATGPGPDVLRAVLGDPVDLKASISALWSPHGRVRQVVGAPVSATKLGIRADRRQAGNRRIFSELGRLVAVRAAVAFPRRIVVVAQKEAVERLQAGGLPPNVDVGHFGALAGLDQFKAAAGMIVIGRILPDPLAMESAAGVLTGQPAAVTSSENGQTRWYVRTSGGIRLDDGSAVPVEHPTHPDPVAEELRWQACEAQLVQAVGRLRPLRRGAREPFFLDVVCDVPLPITVGEVLTWDAARVGGWADMAAAGVVLSSRSDVVAAFADLALSDDQARAMVAGFPGDSSIRISSIDESPGNRRVRRARYKVRGRGKKDVQALVLPNGPQGESALRAWLEARIGAVERVEVERFRAEAQAVFADIGERAVGSLAAAGRLSFLTGMSLGRLSTISALGQALRSLPLEAAPRLALILQCERTGDERGMRDEAGS